MERYFFKPNTYLYDKYTYMNQKLTLSVESSVIKRAKDYAKKTGRSLSEIVEGYLTTLVTNDKKTAISPKLKKLAGIANLPDDFDERKELKNYFEAKHL